MKRSSLMLLLFGVAIIFFGCEKMDPLVPDSNTDQEISSLKSAKVKTTFTGRSDYVADINPPTITVQPNSKYKTKWKDVIGEWVDVADDARVTGKTLWYANYYWEDEAFTSNAKVWGKAELFVGVLEPGDEPLGKWEITWHGYITDNGLKASVDAVGTGTEGNVKGLVAHWKYTMDILGVGFFYQTEGTIH